MRFQLPRQRDPCIRLLRVELYPSCGRVYVRPIADNACGVCLSARDAKVDIRLNHALADAIWTGAVEAFGDKFTEVTAFFALSDFLDRSQIAGTADFFLVAPFVAKSCRLSEAFEIDICAYLAQPGQ